MMSLNTATTYRIISNLYHLYKDRVNISIRQYDRFPIPCPLQGHFWPVPPSYNICC